MATGFLILTLYGLCIFLIVALVAIGGGLYFWGRREEHRAPDHVQEDKEPTLELD